jgi:hypothetical protein
MAAHAYYERTLSFLGKQILHQWNAFLYTAPSVIHLWVVGQKKKPTPPLPPPPYCNIFILLLSDVVWNDTYMLLKFIFLIKFNSESGEEVHSNAVLVRRDAPSVLSDMVATLQCMYSQRLNILKVTTLTAGTQ